MRSTAQKRISDGIFLTRDIQNDQFVNFPIIFKKLSVIDACRVISYHSKITRVFF